MRGAQLRATAANLVGSFITPCAICLHNASPRRERRRHAYTRRYGGGGIVVIASRLSVRIERDHLLPDRARAVDAYSSCVHARCSLLSRYAGNGRDLSRFSNSSAILAQRDLSTLPQNDVINAIVRASRSPLLLYFRARVRRVSPQRIARTNNRVYHAGSRRGSSTRDLLIDPGHLGETSPSLGSRGANGEGDWFVRGT